MHGIKCNKKPQKTGQTGTNASVVLCFDFPTDGLVREVTWHHLPLRLRSVILKLRGQNALDDTILAPSFMLENMLFNCKTKSKRQNSIKKCLQDIWTEMLFFYRLKMLFVYRLNPHSTLKVSLLCTPYSTPPQKKKKKRKESILKHIVINTYYCIHGFLDICELSH